MQFTSLIKKPSAVIPLVMSVAALLLIIVVLSTFGVSHNQDEGAPARVFQLLILLQLPIVVYFAIKWLPRSPTPALFVMLLQSAAAFLPILIVVWLERIGAI